MKRFLYLALASALVGCAGVGNGAKPLVAVSIAPLGWAVENIADTLVDIEVVVPEAVGAENYDPTPRQVARLESADIYFKVGLLDFEKDLAEANAVDLSQEVDILGGRDPHIWLSVRNMRSIAGRICKELCRLYPQDSQLLSARYGRLDSTLEEMDHKYTAWFSGEENVLIVHPSLSFMARDYGFNQIAVEADGKEPSAAELKAIFDMVSQKGIKTIYYSIQDNPKEAEAIASEAGIEAVKYDPLSENWKDELETLVSNICKN